MTPHEELLRFEQWFVAGEGLARIEAKIEGFEWMVRGLYALLIVAVFVNHFWK